MDAAIKRIEEIVKAIENLSLEDLTLARQHYKNQKVRAYRQTDPNYYEGESLSRYILEPDECVVADADFDCVIGLLKIKTALVRKRKKLLENQTRDLSEFEDA